MEWITERLPHTTKQLPHHFITIPSLRPYKDANSLKQNTQHILISALMTALPFEIINVFSRTIFFISNFYVITRFIVKQLSNIQAKIAAYMNLLSAGTVNSLEENSHKQVVWCNLHESLLCW